MNNILVLKAYKCIFPYFFNDSYQPTMFENKEEFQIIYGKNQKEAVNNRCKLDENYSFWELKKHIRTKRFKEKDLYNQPKSVLLKDLTNKHIHHLTHSLGVKIGDICPESFYRNYSVYYNKNEDCEYLVKIELMENWQKYSNEVYGVTEKGIKAVESLLLTTKDKL